MNITVTKGRLKSVRTIIRNPALCPVEPDSAVAVVRPAAIVRPPIDVELAQKLWATLHGRALGWTGEDDSAFLKEFAQSLPCGVCRSDWNRMMAATPPDFGKYFAWTVERHNEVASRLDHETWTIERAIERWSA